MKRRLVLTIVLAGCGLGLLLAGLSGQAADAGGPCDRYVLAIDGSNSSDCSDEGHPCKTVQYALGRAATGDRICVADRTLAPGPTVYHGTVSVTRSVTLDGAWQASCAGGPPLVCDFTAVPCNPANVVLDGQGNGRVISISGHIAPTVQCFTITGGDAAGQGGDPGGSVQNDAGGGIYSRNAAPIILNNVISGNFGCDICPVAYGRGGGLYLLNAAAGALISGNLIINNVADNSTWGEGGGIMLRDSNAQVRFNSIETNRAGLSAGNGGGVMVSGGSPLLADNRVMTNVAGQAVIAVGGGICVQSSTRLTIERNLIQDNRALWDLGSPGTRGQGGGIYFSADGAGVAPLIRDNTVRDNLAGVNGESFGGGMYLHGLDAGARVSDNAVSGNIAGHNHNGSGGGFYLDSFRGTLSGNRIEDNRATQGGTLGEGGGLFINQGAPLVRSNVISGNDAAVFGVGVGGGMALSTCPIFTMTNNIVARNRASDHGSGIYVSHSAGILAFNTIAENQGGEGSGVRVEVPMGTIAITNNIILGHAVGIMHGNPAADQVRARCTLFEGNTLNFSAGVASSQEVAGPAALTPDYRLNATSGAIDHACPLAWVTTDIDGHPRPIGVASDVGAAEWYAALLNLPVVVRAGSAP